ncbi:LysR family transcriptional regulator ArgP [Gordonia sp. TBRC 11910]|uniref:LysR family transcriptional regulator ArgP n=1 Tax=Gordonia asplenii TaxID=2725283 RepID=A0A848KY84_9ACTN|nr:LysR family transcriptional regulator ArgP [Gordonia asplenii]NMO00408.1 LysR family transcriptional regulator ArgP [Gordonia asplenii]
MDFELAHLRALTAAADLGTFDAAARHLHITPSALSQRIKALETATGRVLLVRSRPIQVTDAGAAVLRLARQVDALAADVVRDLGADAQTVIPLAVNADSLATWVLPALARVTADWPTICIDIHRDDQEHTADLLRAGTVMAAITSQSRAVQGCTVTRLGVMRYRACAAPDFVARWFDGPITSAALGAAPYVDFDRKDELQNEFLRRRGVDQARRHQVPGSSEFIDAIRLGMGWGMVPSGWRRRLGDQLVVLDVDDPGVEVELYWQQWSLRTPALDAVASAIASAAAGQR